MLPSTGPDADTLAFAAIRRFKCCRNKRKKRFVENFLRKAKDIQQCHKGDDHRCTKPFVCSLSWALAALFDALMTFSDQHFSNVDGYGPTPPPPYSSARALCGPPRRDGIPTN